ncbi:LamG-like jellyroll fold domain-containing protein [Streptomyces sp. NPDC056401]|uniref:LamG-like jellyroll fold domain-containing protein n=1 Tax=Streptomyces sp. NPDC056401 TaxID=3345809 RepID=UPI0035DABF35
MGSPAIAAAATTHALGVAQGAQTAQRASSGTDRVEIASRTTETSQTFANPDGTFTLESSAAPVRARQDDGSWAPIDTTLVETSDGRLRAKSTTSRVEFAQGGSGSSSISLAKGDKKVDLTWPDPLPKPVVDGSTATYVNVLPAVDLKLTAVDSGFTQVLVVKTAAAAANPKLEKLSMTVKGTGVGTTPGRDGGVRFVDADGRTVFDSPVGKMWDSSGDKQQEPVAFSKLATRAASAEPVRPDDGGGVQDPATAPSDGDKTADVAVALAGNKIELTPDLGLLRGAGTVFPVYVDPPVKGLTAADWTAVSSDGDRFFEFTGDKGIGHCSNYAGYLCSNTPYDQRMYFEYPMTSLYGKKILDATFEVYQTWSFTCSQHNYWLVRVDKDISSSTSWGSKPNYADLMSDRWSAMGRGTLCDPAQPADWLRFNDNPQEPDENLTPTIQWSADTQRPNLTLELRAEDESDASGWARFRSDAKLSVTYISQPGTPNPVGIQSGTTGRACNPSTNPFVTSTTTPRFLAGVQSSDGAQAQLQAAVEVWKADGSKVIWGTSSPDNAWVADNALRDFTAPALAPQTDYAARFLTKAYYATDQGQTGVLYSEWSTWCYFRIDTDSPPAPTVVSADGLYKPAPTAPASGGVGVAGKFTFTPVDTNAAQSGIQSDVVSYKWRLNSGTLSAQLTVPTGTAKTVSISPDQPGENTLQVWGYDAAGHSSLTGYYSFNVKGGDAPVGVWSLNGSGADTNAGATKRPLTTGGSATFTGQSRAGSRALSLNGTTGYAASAVSPFDNTKSYTVSTWARVTPGATGVNTVLGVDGQAGSGFYLSYEAAANVWSFRIPKLDTAEPVTYYRAASNQPATAGVWTHLTGVFDAAAQEMRLYVNGRMQEATDVPAVWKASGPLQVGRALWRDTYVDNFAGSIDEVKTWSRELMPSEIAQEASLEDEDASDGTVGDPIAARTGDWNATTASGTTIADKSGYGHTMTLRGATLGIDPDTAGNADLGLPTRQVMALNGTSSYANAGGPLVDETGSFTATAWVRLDAEKLKDTTKSYQVRAMGQNGTTNGSWYVTYEQPAGSSAGKWRFVRPNSDVNAPASTVVTQSDVADKDQWGRLTVVYDAQRARTSGSGDSVTRGGLYLYVNTAQSGGSAGISYTKPWQGTGTFEVGRGKADGVSAQYFPGHIADVRVWAGAMTASAIGDMYANEQ